MARGMKRYLRPADPAFFAIADAFEGYVTQSMPHDRQRVVRGEIATHAVARMVRMAMGDERPVHREPRVDEKITGRAIDALVRELKNRLARHAGDIGGAAHLHRSPRGQTLPLP